MAITISTVLQVVWRLPPGHTLLLASIIHLAVFSVPLNWENIFGNCLHLTKCIKLRKTMSGVVLK
jgi:hypothetical protein